VGIGAVDGKRPSNAAVLLRAIMMKFEDERRAGYSGPASALQFSGDSAVGDYVNRVDHCACRL
jgi:hypothetical protein